MTRKAPAKAGVKAAPPKDPRREYVVTETGYAAGLRRTKGETLMLHPEEAKYEDRLEEAPAKTVKAKPADEAAAK